MQINNIIFDYGGVILNIDPQKTLKKLVKLGVKGFDKLAGKIIENKLYFELEKGEISPAEFRVGLRKLLNFEFTDLQLDEAWNALILDMPPGRIKLLEQIRHQYRIFMLSNTNEIHYNRYRGDLEKQFGYALFSELFEKVYLSHKIGYRKPDYRIYDYVIQDSGVEAGETLFIDDNKENIKAARRVGLLGYHLCEGTDITDLFKDGRLAVNIKDLV